MNYGSFGAYPYSKYSKFATIPYGKGYPFSKFSKFPYGKFPFGKTPFSKGFGYPATKGYNASYVIPSTTVATTPFIGY